MSGDNIWTDDWDAARAPRRGRGVPGGAAGQITAQAPTASQTGERLWLVYDVPKD